MAEERTEREQLEREAQAERERIEREQQRIEKLEELNQQRIADLHKSGELLRLSQDVRALVEQVRAAMVGRADIDAATLQAWERWALEEADKIDPILSEQFLKHLRPPLLETGDS